MLTRPPLKTITVVSCIFFMVLTVRAQDDPLTAIRKIYAAYNKSRTLRFEGTMKMYTKNNPGKIIETYAARYLIKGQSFNCSIGTVRMLQNERYYVSVDKSVKIIIIGNKKDLSSTLRSPVLNIDQFGNWIKDKHIDATVISRNATMLLDLKDPAKVTGYDHYAITYDAATGFMRKVVLEVSDDNDSLHKTVVLEINYTQPVPCPEKADTFSEKQFFSLQHNRVWLNSDYRDYQLINQL